MWEYPHRQKAPTVDYIFAAGMLKNKSGNIYGTRKDRGKVTIDGL